MKVPLVPQLRWLKKFVAHPATAPSELQDLFEKARDPAQSPYHWKGGDPLARAHNAHYTNRPGELENGLTHDYNFVEGDVWLEGAVRHIPLLDHFREPIMSHDPQSVDGLPLAEWLDVAKSSGKGIKIDMKQSAAIPKIIKEVQERDIPQDRLIFNADVAFGPGLKKSAKIRVLDAITDFITSRKEMKQIREAFPQATLSLGHFTGKQPKGTVYSDAQLDEVIDFAQEMGGPISFPLRAEFVTPHVVEKLKPHGLVSIWNDPKTFSPENKELATRRFRDMGVDGIIDLRTSQEPLQDPFYDSDIVPPVFKGPWYEERTRGSSTAQV